MTSDDEIEARPQNTENATDYYYDDDGLSNQQRLKFRRLRQYQTGYSNGEDKNEEMANRKKNREAFRVVASNCELSKQQHIRADHLFAKANKEFTLIQGYTAEMVALAVCVYVANESVPGNDTRWKVPYNNDKDCPLGTVADNFNINRKHLGRVYYKLADEWGKP